MTVEKDPIQKFNISFGTKQDLEEGINEFEDMLSKWVERGNAKSYYLEIDTEELVITVNVVK